MVDIASMILAGFQDDLVSAFGASIGWVFGHIILIFLLISILWIIQNREHIISESGWGYPNLMDISVIIMLTVVQYVIYVNLFDFPSTASGGLSIFWALTLRWHILVLE